MHRAWGKWSVCTGQVSVGWVFRVWGERARQKLNPWGTERVCARWGLPAPPACGFLLAASWGGDAGGWWCCQDPPASKGDMGCLSPCCRLADGGCGVCAGQSTPGGLGWWRHTLGSETGSLLLPRPRSCAPFLPRPQHRQHPGPCGPSAMPLGPGNSPWGSPSGSGAPAALGIPAPGSWQCRVCVLLQGILHANKCQGKPEGGRCHPPAVPKNITAQLPPALFPLRGRAYTPGSCVAISIRRDL